MGSAPVDMTARMREARAASDLSAQLLAERIGLATAEYEDLEAYADEASSSVSLDVLARLASALAVPIDQLLVGESVAVEAFPLADLQSRVRERLDAAGGREAYERAIGWSLDSFLQNPAAAWADWNLDCLRDVCDDVGVEWIAVVKSHPASG